MQFELTEIGARAAPPAGDTGATKRAGHSLPRDGGSESAPAPTAQAPPRVEVSFENQNIPVYRFVNAAGDLILQVPPEEILRVSRHIQEMLQAEQQAAPALDIKL
jgi:hypothetical protein